jgi:hypothetical protein
MSRFNATPDRLLWYFSSIAVVIGHHRSVAPVGEIEDGMQTLASPLDIHVSQ